MPNDAETIMALALKAEGEVAVLEMDDGRQFITHPPGYIVKDVSLPQNVNPPIPKFVKQIVSVQTAHSLIDYVERFKTQATVIFADIDDNAIEAVIDYHAQGESTHKDPVPAIASHRALLRLQHSESWGTWKRVDGSMMKQADFARFLEENSEDISAPSGGQLLEMVLDLEKSRSIRVSRKMRTAGSDDGEGGAEVQTDGTVLPSVFLLALPVYFGEKPVEVRAYTRDALTGDKVIQIGFKLARTEQIRQNEFLRISKEIADATGVPMIAGSIADFAG